MNFIFPNLEKVPVRRIGPNGAFHYKKALDQMIEYDQNRTGLIRFYYCIK